MITIPLINATKQENKIPAQISPSFVDNELYIGMYLTTTF